MPVTLNPSAQTAPGVYVYQDAAGPVPTAIASFNRVYYLGGATGGPGNEPRQIISRDDFVNVFGGSAAINLNNIDFFFANVPAGQLYYVRVAAAPMVTVTIDTVTSSATYTVTINGSACSYVADANATAEEIITGLIAAINGNTTVNNLVEGEFEIDAAGDEVFTNNRFYIRQLNPSGNGFATVGTTGSLTATAIAAPPEPSYWDYLYTLSTAFNEDMEQGFLVAPQAFYSLTRQFERTQIANALNARAAAENFDWMAFADCGPPSTINTKTAFKTEGMLYASDRGHLAYYCPWLVDSDNDDVSPALAAACVALRRYSVEGFNQPAAGTKYPLRGVSGLKVPIYLAEHADLNANQINVLKDIRGVGVTVYGARSRSINPYYRFINTRVILNVYARTLRNALTNGNLLFSVIDGQGALFNRIKETADLVAYRFWAGGAFFGATPALAFKNICDRSNNPALDLEDGIVRLDSYVAPSPTAERIFVGLFRVPIDQVLQQGTTT